MEIREVTNLVSEPAASAHGWTDPSYFGYQAERTAHWDKVARWMDEHKGLGSAYHKRLAEIYRYLIPKGSRVLEVGCARGDLLAALEPALGVGVDFSEAMIERGRARYPNLRFEQQNALDLEIDDEFDFIIMSDVVNDLWDAQAVFDRLKQIVNPHARLVLNFYNRFWEWPLSIARHAGLARANLIQNWFTFEDVSGLLELADFEVIRHREEVLLPLHLPVIAGLADKYLAKIWPFRLFDLTQFIVARPKVRQRISSPRVSVVIPARNEEGNVASIFARVPNLEAGTEMIFVEGGSTDNTYESLERTIALNPGRDCKLIKQTGSGKGYAVREGLRWATGDVLMILDSDLTVPPEDLSRFLEVLVSGKCDFVNGSRLVYPMESQSMRTLNLVGNKFFSMAFSWLLGQPIKDTLCGTKALWKADYERIAANRSYFGDFDPFGDFDLLFGASKLNLKIVDLPIRYRDRTYGETNIDRWRHGWLLLRMVIFAARRIKFI